MTATHPSVTVCHPVRRAIRVFRYCLAILLLAAAGGFLAIKGDSSIVDYLAWVVAAPYLALTAVPSFFCLGVPISLGFLAWATWPKQPLLGAWTPHRLLRLRTVSAGVALVVPLSYAFIQFVTATATTQGRFGFLSGCVAVVVATLTWRFTGPRRARYASGRPIQIGLVRNAAVVVGTAVISAGSSYARNGAAQVSAISGPQGTVGLWFAAISWPIWGIALIVTGLVYAELRRRMA